MEKSEIKVEVQKTDSGRIRILFDDGTSYPIPVTMENLGLITAFEIELKYALKK